MRVYERMRILYDIYEVAEKISELAQTTSTTEKQCLLRRNAGIPGFKEVLKHLYNPYVTTGIKRAKLDNVTFVSESCTYVPTGQITLEDVLKYFSCTRTGDYADVNYATAFIAQVDDDANAAWLAEGIVTKDLQCGVSATTLNKVYGAGFIPIVGIMRGKQAPDSFQGVYIATEKIDGNRRLFFHYADGSVAAFTRSGKPDYGLTEIFADIEKLPKGYMYDCECVAEGTFADNIALRQATASALNRASASKTGVHALCFDMVSIEQYNTGCSLDIAIKRKAKLAATFGDEESFQKLIKSGNLITKAEYAYEYAEPLGRDLRHINALPVLGIVYNAPGARKLAMPIWEVSGEGLMLVDILSNYVVSSTPKKEWLKIKATLECVAKVIDVYEGTNANEGKLGGVNIAFLGPDSKAHYCKVGSGFSKQERELFYWEPQRIIGKIIEVDHFGFSQAQGQDSYSLNCPIFKRVQGAE